MTEVVDRLPLQSTMLEVARMTRPQREQRVVDLVASSHDILEREIAKHADGHQIVAKVLLYSGGNDSTTLAHMFKDVATHAAHANTTVGIEETRQFVRDTCASWGLPLIEKLPPEGQHYRDFVLGNVYAWSRKHGDRRRVYPGGFPGPAQHFFVYQRLKERCLEQVRNELVDNPRKQRVVFVAGRRRDESKRRQQIPVSERRGSTIWISPLVEWTKADLNTYRTMNPGIPQCRASGLIHMSGECLCGAFAKQGELDEIEMWFPQDVAAIRELERLLENRIDIPEERRKYGWGAYKHIKPSKTGPLCDSCVAPEAGEIVRVAA